MANEESTNKTSEELVERAWSLAQSMRTCTLITFDGQIPKARPMSAHVNGGTVSFLASATSDTVAHLALNHIAVVMFSDTVANKYVTFTGDGTASNDRSLVKSLWSPFAKAWWDSSDDPDIRAIVVKPSKTELWDGSNKLIALALMATAAITGAKPAVGDHANVEL